LFFFLVVSATYQSTMHCATGIAYKTLVCKREGKISLRRQRHICDDNSPLKRILKEMVCVRPGLNCLLIGSNGVILWAW